MGSIGRKINRDEACQALKVFRSMIIPKHVELGIDDIKLSGSLRRGKSVDIGDIDLICITISGYFDVLGMTTLLTEYNYKVDAAGQSIIRAIRADGIQFDLFACTEAEYPCCQTYLTGPQEYNIQMRAVAKRKGMRLNQRSITYVDNGDPIKVKYESDVFHALNCEFIEPENRFNFYESCKYHKYKGGNK